jgi:hypothetical protein
VEIPCVEPPTVTDPPVVPSVRSVTLPLAEPLKVIVTVLPLVLKFTDGAASLEASAATAVTMTCVPVFVDGVMSTAVVLYWSYGLLSDSEVVGLYACAQTLLLPTDAVIVEPLTLGLPPKWIRLNIL